MSDGWFSRVRSRYAERGPGLAPRRSPHLERKTAEIDRALRKKLRRASAQAVREICLRMKRATRESARQAYQMVKKGVPEAQAVRIATNAALRVATREPHLIRPRIGVGYDPREPFLTEREADVLADAPVGVSHYHRDERTIGMTASEARRLAGRRREF